MTDHPLADLRRLRPLTQVVTNFVAMELTANALLAAGARPAMVEAQEEAPAFAARGADAICLNIGTLTADRRNAIHAVAAAAAEAGTPWVLDPVGIGIGAFRYETARALLARGPAVVRGNASEIITLQHGRSRSASPESADETAAAGWSAVTLARRHGGIIAVTGGEDFVTDGRRGATIRSGHPLITRVTATGCALSALVAAFCGVAADPWTATLTALLHYGIASERAASVAAGPGSFVPAFLDALYRIEPADLPGDRIEIERLG